MEFNATLVISMISFGFFIIIMNQIYYKPIITIINERKQNIDENYRVAQISKDEADSICNEKETRLNKTDLDAKNLLCRKVEAAEENVKDMINEAKRNYITEITLAKSVLAGQEEKVFCSLREDTENLADIISSKILEDA